MKQLLHGIGHGLLRMLPLEVLISIAMGVFVASQPGEYSGMRLTGFSGTIQTVKKFLEACGMTFLYLAWIALMILTAVNVIMAIARIFRR